MTSDYTVSRGVRMSSSRACLLPHLQRTNLHILLNTHVTRVLLEEDSKRAIGVEAIRDGQHRLTIRARKEVIVSAGTVRSPQLVMLSVIGDAAELRHHGIMPLVNRPAVGRHLHNHLSVISMYSAKAKPQTRLNWSTATEYLLNRGRLASPEIQLTIYDDYVTRLQA